MNFKKIIIKQNKVKALLNRHPWVFSGAVKNADKNLKNGEIAILYSAEGEFLAYGSFCKKSQIRVRIWSFEETNIPNQLFFHDIVKKSIAHRKIFIDENTTTAYRLVNSEADSLPGVIVDLYENYLVCQFLHAGAEFIKSHIITALQSEFPEYNIYERSDSSIRKKEGLPPVCGIIKGEIPPKQLTVLENNFKMNINIASGHKTGFYLDQRDSRKTAGDFAKDKEILNCFSYTGGFSVSCLKGGAKHVTNIEASREAIDLSYENCLINNFNEDQFTDMNGDVFEILRMLREENKKFDMIILDPPKFAENRRNLISSCRGYKDINFQAMHLLNPNGLLFTFSCSGLIDEKLFTKVVFDASKDAKKHVKIIKRLSQASDHMQSLNFPEGYYLKGLMCLVQ